MWYEPKPKRLNNVYISCKDGIKYLHVNMVFVHITLTMNGTYIFGVQILCTLDLRIDSHWVKICVCNPNSVVYLLLFIM